MILGKIAISKVMYRCIENQYNQSAFYNIEVYSSPGISLSYIKTYIEMNGMWR